MERLVKSAGDRWHVVVHSATDALGRTYAVEAIDVHDEVTSLVVVKPRVLAVGETIEDCVMAAARVQAGPAPVNCISSSLDPKTSEWSAVYSLAGSKRRAHYSGFAAPGGVVMSRMYLEDEPTGGTP